MESCRQFVDNKVTFCVVSVNHSEGDVIQRKAKRRQKNIFSNVLLKPSRIQLSLRYACSFFTHQIIKRGKYIKLTSFYTPGNGFEPLLEEPESSVLPLDDPGTIILKEKTPQAGLEPATYRLTAGCSTIELLRNFSILLFYQKTFFL